MTNVGCDDLEFDSSHYFGDLDFNSSLVSRTAILKPGDTTYYHVYLNPARKGKRTGYLVLTSTDNTGTHTDSVAISTTVTDGTRVITQSLDSISFGTTTLCEERDTLITLHNTGCDTLRVLGYLKNGSGFRVDAFDSMIILPHDSARVGIHTQLDTSGGVLTNSEVITFTSDADNTALPITLTRRLTPPSHYRFHMASLGSPSGTSGERVSFQLVSDQPNIAGIQTIDYDLSLNTDLLDLKNTHGPNAVKVTGNHITITGSPNIQIASDGSVATFDYEIYLTKDSTTNLTATNFHLNNADPKFETCVASARTTDTAFDYIYRCSDHTIQEFLRTGVLRITSIVPNPTQGEVTISIESPMKQSAVVMVYDLLGKEVLRRVVKLGVGSNSVLLETTDLARSRYVVRVVAATSTVSGAFVKE
jgi:hypothetical protein